MAWRNTVGDATPTLKLYSPVWQRMSLDRYHLPPGSFFLPPAFETQRVNL